MAMRSRQLERSTNIPLTVPLPFSGHTLWQRPSDLLLSPASKVFRDAGYCLACEALWHMGGSEISAICQPSQQTRKAALHILHCHPDHYNNMPTGGHGSQTTPETEPWNRDSILVGGRIEAPCLFFMFVFLFVHLMINKIVYIIALQEPAKLLQHLFYFIAHCWITILRQLARWIMDVFLLSVIVVIHMLCSMMLSSLLIM